MQRITGGAEQFLVDLNTIQQVMQKAQQQTTSGLRVSNVGDDPSAVAPLLQLQGDSAVVAQVKQNLGRVKSEVDTAEGALEDAVKLLDSARSLGLQGANGTTSAAQRTVLSNQVSSLLEQMVGLSRVQSEGRYVFSGDADQSPAYQFNSNGTSGVDLLAPSQATRLIQDANGTTFAVARTATEIFDDRDAQSVATPNNVFDALNALRLALAQNDTAGINAGIDKLRTASDYLNQQLAWYGSVQNRVAAASDIADKFQVQQATDLSHLRDADVASAAITLAQAQTHQQAAMAAESKTMSLPTLFDFFR